MRARSIALAGLLGGVAAWGGALVGCSTPPEAPRDELPAETPPTIVAKGGENGAPAPATTAPAAAYDAGKVDWKPAWNVGPGQAWVPGDGRLLTAKGTVAVSGGKPCSGGFVVKTDAPAVAWLPAGAAETFPDAPAVQAAILERAGWRLGDVLGPPEGILPGGVTEKDPAKYEGITVRSTRKTRRQGPPVYVVVGDRDGKVGVAVVDKEADKVLASDVIAIDPSLGPPWPASSDVPALDADGDGRQELFVAGDGDKGGFRAVYRLDLGVETRLVRLDLATSPAISCK